MQVKNSLTTVLPGVDHQSEALVQVLVPGNPAGGLEEAAKLFCFIAFRYIRHMIFGNHQNMTGCLGIYVSKGEPVVSLGNYICRYLTFYYFAEKAVFGLFFEVCSGFGVHFSNTIIRIVRDIFGEKL